MTAEQGSEIIVTLTDIDVLLENVYQRLAEINLILGYLQGFAIFFVVVILCWFVYKFFDMFFR